jgi:hypothetical protein
MTQALEGWRDAVTGRLLDRAGSSSTIQSVPYVVASLPTAVCRMESLRLQGQLETAAILGGSNTLYLRRARRFCPTAHTSRVSTSERVCAEKVV